MENPELLSLAAGFTDTSTLPAEKVRDVVKGLVADKTPAEYLQYGSHQGRPGLRRLLSDHLCSLEPELDHHQVQ
ncbi:MAG: hypothetical protein J6386_19720 [Candidatus Synoicihabitans palmerolidicus]|nr:hypothetical protein [Candidatus Synoicihabitans palmerolidicus]